MIGVLALDPGVGRFGAVLIETDGHRHECQRVGVFESEQRVSDFDIRLADDRVRRGRELSRWFDAFVDGFTVDIVAAEAMSFPRGAHAIVLMSLAWGVICRYLDQSRLPYVSAMPSYWRTCLIGERASRRGSRVERKIQTARREAAAHAVAVRTVPSVVPFIRRLSNEHQLHALDATGVFAWSLQTAGMREALRW
jgi:Holliday junction resolvasome RuvABC endonuclease subunit